ncbi:MAG: hypothetical protein JWM73_1002 [Solirubrobacterales bacterium]|nr:hypothetical protein [Solirubrobacterales bacterium]
MGLGVWPQENQPDDGRHGERSDEADQQTARSCPGQRPSFRVSRVGGAPTLPRARSASTRGGPAIQVCLDSGYEVVLLGHPARVR